MPPLHPDATAALACIIGDEDEDGRGGEEERLERSCLGVFRGFLLLGSCGSRGSDIQ